MTWDNYGKFWSIDHVLPLEIFDFDKDNEQTMAFNWKNLQPHTENASKNDTVRLWEYFNVLISAHRFIQLRKLDVKEYQGMKETLFWLRNILKQGKNLEDERLSFRLPRNGQSAANPLPSTEHGEGSTTLW